MQLEDLATWLLLLGWHLGSKWRWRHRRLGLEQGREATLRGHRGYRGGLVILALHHSLHQVFSVGCKGLERGRR